MKNKQYLKYIILAADTMKNHQNNYLVTIKTEHKTSKQEGFQRNQTIVNIMKRKKHRKNIKKCLHIKSNLQKARTTAVKLLDIFRKTILILHIPQNINMHKKQKHVIYVLIQIIMGRNMETKNHNQPTIYKTVCGWSDHGHQESKTSFKHKFYSCIC